MKTPFTISARPDVMLRKYAHFEDPAPATPPDPAPPTPPAPITFTDEQQKVIDKLVGTARGDGKKTALTDFLKELGFEKPDDLKTLVKTVKEQDEAKKTAEQKLADAAAKDKERADKADKELADFKAQVEADKRAATRDSAITKALVTAKATPEKVLKLLKVDQPDALTAVLKEDGTVDEAKVKALVETAKKAYPEDFGGRGRGTLSNADGRVPSSEDQAARERNFRMMRRGF